MVTCPTIPELSYVAQSVDHLFAVRERIAEHSGVAAARTWLQIEVRAGRIGLRSNVHPRHLLNLHTFTFPRASNGLVGDTIDDLVSSVLLHENQYARDNGGHTVGVRFTMSFHGGREILCPPTGTYPLADVLAGLQSAAVTRGAGEGHGIRCWLQQWIQPTAKDRSVDLSAVYRLHCVIVAHDQATLG